MANPPQRFRVMVRAPFWHQKYKDLVKGVTRHCEVLSTNRSRHIASLQVFTKFWPDPGAIGVNVTFHIRALGNDSLSYFTVGLCRVHETFIEGKMIRKRGLTLSNTTDFLIPTER